jgi:hypothetical protein
MRRYVWHFADRIPAKYGMDAAEIRQAVHDAAHENEEEADCREDRDAVLGEGTERPRVSWSR